MRVLVVEDGLERIKFFIEILGKFNLTVVDNSEEAIVLLESILFDMVFLDHDLGAGGYGADVAAHLANNPDNPNNENAIVVVHTMNESVSKKMLNKLIYSCPKVVGIPFGPRLFYYLGLTTPER